MYKSNNVILIGFKGSRKTTISRDLAKRLEFQFIDFDDFIVEMYKHDTGKLIKYRDIEHHHGRDYFLELQRRGMARIRNHSRTVLATAGNTPFVPEVQRILVQMGHIIFLEEDPEKVLSRITAKGIPRFIDKNDVKGSFKEFYRTGIDLYRTLADYIIKTGGLSDKQVIEKVVSDVGHILY